MDPKELLEIIAFIRGKNDTANFLSENKESAAASIRVLFESKKLYELLSNSKSTLDEIVYQISAKNKAAIQYKAQTGTSWLF